MIPEQVGGGGGVGVGELGGSECGVEFEVEGLFNAGGDAGIEGEAALGESGVAEEEVGVADGGAELRELEHTVGLGAGEEVVGAIVKLDGERLGGVA